ncbi:HAD family hydrolase [Picrophilus oshimae]|uniref:phosphoserine phosphatase n=1 Tax=Picrophilus torridus (strain ATCC 700027 / DSM 9790 / JCM 10055 / NBRC 100828 / KAW 2/3) TaxID=1122961 RepID=Q6L0Z1_PICTO|nr:HAD-IB family phosphatase [Picrophilus oshimae]AAT43361.1 phosphoserine phosphatase [Picrophilus oshimae DSM 9789]SMD30330.1 phosphoserine phosphatase [Picrophilus oshimae DSM 9789]
MIKLIAFDMDGVLLKHRNSWERVFSNLFDFKEYTFQGLSKKRIKIPEEINIRRHISKSFDVNDINNDLYKLYDFRERTNIKMVIISAGVHSFAEKIANIYGFDDYIGNDIIIKNGYINFIKNVDPSKKNLNLDRFLRLYKIKKDEALSVGDTVFDASMKKSSKYFVAFNPFDYNVIKNADFTVYKFDELINIVKAINYGINIEI